MESQVLRILSLGAGVQSSTLALMAEHGEIEKPDCAIFADTGNEPEHCHQWLDWLEKQLSYPVYRVSNGNIRDDLLENINSSKRFSSIPFFVEGGIGRRQCTATYKIKPVQNKARELLGFEPKKRIPKNTVTMLVGISRDEAQRMKPSRVKWINNIWPLIDLSMTRNDCLAWMRNHGYPEPPKSSCIICPFHSNAHWREMKKKQPNDFADACFIDNQLRKKGTRGKMKKAEFMHRQLVPLEKAHLGDEWTQDIFDMFGNECEGMCGV